MIFWYRKLIFDTRYYVLISEIPILWYQKIMYFLNHKIEFLISENHTWYKKIGIKVLFGVLYCSNVLLLTMLDFSLGLYSLSGKTSYRKISWSLEAARWGFKLFQSLWNLAGTSATLLPRCLSNFRAIRPLQHPISWLRDFTRFGGKTSYRLVNRGPDVYSDSNVPRIGYIGLRILPMYGAVFYEMWNVLFYGESSAVFVKMVSYAKIRWSTGLGYLYTRYWLGTINNTHNLWRSNQEQSIYLRTGYRTSFQIMEI